MAEATRTATWMYLWQDDEEALSAYYDEDRGPEHHLAAFGTSAFLDQHRVCNLRNYPRCVQRRSSCCTTGSAILPGQRHRCHPVWAFHAGWLQATRCHNSSTQRIARCEH